jgi:23S rRNA (guanosine2251-2'-O)-methyltransferase
MSGDDVRDLTFGSKKVLFLGSEGEGISNRILKMCDQKLKVVMEREFDSLNVSAAAAILCDRMR